jgi:hypothetical protein
VLTELSCAVACSTISSAAATAQGDVTCFDCKSTTMAGSQNVRVAVELGNTRRVTPALARSAMLL